MPTYSNSTDFDSILIAPTDINDPDRLLLHYRERLKASWRKSVADILGMGEILTEAKERLPHGHFKTLIAEVGMERSMAARLMAISDCLSNVDNHLHLRLPASVTTLYHMSRLEHQVLEAGFRDSTFTTETTAKQVQALLPPPEPKKPPSRLNQMRRFMIKYREAMELEFADNPVLERTIPREMLKIIEAAKERRRGKGNDQDEQPSQPPASSPPSRWS